ncbi:MAG: hypothetical protein NTV52_03905, partial [Acidobacteria bacterium]|nr:hypothetical protein [Acidobacteriota bacterium]
ERHVRDGGYADSSEVVSAALAELAARESEGSVDDMTPEELNELRRRIDLADAQIARGEYSTYELSPAGKEAFLEDVRRGGREIARQRAANRK